MAVPTLPGSWTLCNNTTRRAEASSLVVVTSRKGKTPTGPDGVVSVETRRNCSVLSKTCNGGVEASSSKAVPSATKSRSTSRCFLALSFAARFGEIAGVPGILWLLASPGSLLDVADGDAPALARSLHAGEVHVQLLGLADGGIGRLDFFLRGFYLFR